MTIQTDRQAVAPPRLLDIAWPIFLELCLSIGVGIIGTLLAAQISDQAGAAFALANQIAAMLFILFRVVGAGVSVVVAQSLGSSRRHVADAVARAVLGASTWVGTVTALLAIVFSYPLMAMMNAPVDVLPLAAPFLQALAPAMLVDAWNASMAGVMRAHLRVRDAMAVIVCMQIVQLLLAALLMPIYGLIGFAIALSISRALGLSLHLFLWRVRLGLVPRMADWWRLPKRELASVLRIGLPGAAENIAYRLAFMVSVAVAGQLGTLALATQAYALQISYAALLFGLSMGLAVEIVVGHMIGAGHLREASRLVRRTLLWGLAVSVVGATAAAVAGPWLLQQFTGDARIIAVGSVLLWWTVLLEPGRTFNLVVINALRAAGDARYPVIAGAASMVLVLGGGSWLLGIYFDLGLVGVWIAYTADEWIRGLVMWRRWTNHGWLPHARATHRHLRGQPRS